MLSSLLLAGLLVQAQEPRELPDTRLPAVISAEQRRIEQQRRPDALIELDLVDLAQRKPLIDIAEVLSEMPGVIARPRNNGAQDTQIQIRGFGARSPFGVRGLRVEYDGIPATAADGQSQMGHLDLSAGGRVSLIRGPFAALYTNGGGYLRVDGRRDTAGNSDRVNLALGSFGQRRVGFELNAGDELRGTLSGNRYRSEGSREHSRAERTLAAARMDWEPDAASRLSLSAHHQDQPLGEDPQTLTRAEFERDRRLANPAAVLYDTRKSTRQSQLGASYTRQLEQSEWSLSVYTGERQIDQYLSVPRAAQVQPASGGGVIDLGRDYHGWSLRWSRQTELALGQAEFSAEIRDERLSEDRLGYENFVGNQLGVRGQLRRNERNDSRARDAMFRVDLDTGPDWRWSAGVRRNLTDYQSLDRYIVSGNPDDSGEYASSATLPVLGFSYRIRPEWLLHGALGRNQELPTLAELAYRSDAGTGFNTELRPARARQAELGLRYAGERVNAELTAFQVQTTDEIVVASSSGGRTSFQNATATRRRGLELSALWRFSEQWTARGIANWLDARYSVGYSRCPQPPCVGIPPVIAAGQRLPGVPARSANLVLVYQAQDDLGASLEWQAVSATPASDRNQDRVPGYAVGSLSLQWLAPPARWGQPRFTLRVDNLLDRRYSASVIVNEAFGRYFEPAPGRSLWLGVDLALPSCSP
ncbi:MAG: TonB-dependent receptor [Xanthomonadales bacterium]|nr:TonB-dependent receptor [Xanthomonadales bacterium]